MNLDHKVFKDCRVLLDLRENLVQLVLMEQLELLDHLVSPVQLDLLDLEDLQATLTSMTSSLLDPKVMLDQPDLLALLDHQDLHLQVHPPVVEAPSNSDQEWAATDHSCMDLADHQDLRDSQDQKVIWDFQDLLDLMERWDLRVFKVFPVEMAHQDPVAKLDPEDYEDTPVKTDQRENLECLVFPEKVEDPDLLDHLEMLAHKVSKVTLVTEALLVK